METIIFIKEILKSEVTKSLIMIIAAGTAFIIFNLNKKDNLRKAAKLVLLDIREVESVVNQYKLSQIINFNIPILRSNTWKENMHYFVNKFDQDDFEKLNNFFTFSEILETERKKISNSLAMALDEKSKLLQKIIIDLAKENYLNENDYKTKRDLILNIVHNEIYYFEPTVPKFRFEEAVRGINNILETNIGNKLKKFSN